MTQLFAIAAVSFALGAVAVFPLAYALGARHTLRTVRKIMRPRRA